MKSPFLMLFPLTLVTLMILSLGGCASTAPENDNAKQTLDQQVQGTIQDFKTTDPSMQKFFDNAAGYAVFPAITAGALIVGGANGNGELFESGQMTGYCSMTQGNIGAQIGGQSYAEIIFFENASPLAEFKSGQTTFDARATAVAASAGAGTTAAYQHGVLIFTKPQGGLMAQAAVGGQSFKFVPLSSTSP
ncbi:MAG TPA: hypothetical protein VMG59_01125 [Phycisphaerae bacterium]|nr:hypothetical protein [Phycisphaerae bacterium]